MCREIWEYTDAQITFMLLVEQKIHDTTIHNNATSIQGEGEPEEIKEKLSMYGIKPRVIDDNNR